MKIFKNILISIIFIVGIMSFSLMFLPSINIVSKASASNSNDIVEEFKVQVEEGNVAEKGGHISLSSGTSETNKGASFTLTNGTISGGFGLRGGAIYIGNYATFTMDGGIIEGNTGVFGGAIYVANYGNLIINDGIIRYNNAQFGFEMEDGSINYAIYAEPYANVQINGGTFESNSYVKLSNSLKLNVVADEATQTAIPAVGVGDEVYVFDTYYTFNEENLPEGYTYQDTCGYFLDPELTLPVVSGETIFDFSDTEEINIYTKFASSKDCFEFVLNEDGESYGIKASSKFKAGTVTDDSLVMPAAYKGSADIKAKPVTATVTAVNSDGGSFSNTTITSVCFPSTLTTINDYSFTKCYYLEKANTNNQITYMGISAFNNCQALKEILIPNKLTTIRTYAFYCCYALEEVVIPEGVTTIEANAFNTCKALKSLYIPSTIKVMGQTIFNGCSSLANVYADIDLTSWIKLFEENNTKSPFITSGTKSEINTKLYLLGELLVDLVIPDEITELNRITGAFFGIDSIRYVDLNKITFLKYNSFAYCDYLRCVYVPSTVTNLEYILSSDVQFTPFRNSGEGLVLYLENDSVPETFNENWNMYTYNNHLGIQKSEFLEYKQWAINNPDFWFDMYDLMGYEQKSLGKTSKTEIVIPLGTTNIRDTASISNNDEVTKIIIPETVQTMCDEYASNCDELTTLDISANIISSSAFYHCDKLANLSLGSVVSIGDSAFGECTSIVSLSFPSTLKAVGYRSFMYCEELTTLSLNDGLEIIGEESFSYCEKLAGDLVVPTSVTLVGDFAFHYCGKIETITVGGGAELELGAGSFKCNKTYNEDNKYSSLYEITLLPGVKIIGEAAFEVSFSLVTGELFIPNTVTEIRDGAFSTLDITGLTFEDGDLDLIIGNNTFNSAQITELVLPSRLVSLGYQIISYGTVPNGNFKNTTLEKIIILPGEKELTVAAAFSNCDALKWVYLPSRLKTITWYEDTVNEVGIYDNHIFYYCENIIDIYCEAEEQPEGWESDWKHSLRFNEEKSLYEHIYHNSIWGVDYSDFDKMVELQLSYPDYEFYGYDLVSYNGTTETYVEIPQGVKKICYQAFYNKNEILNLKLPNSVEEIEVCAFGQLDNLKSIYLPNSVTILGNGTGIYESSLDYLFVGVFSDLVIYCEYLESQIPETWGAWNYSIVGNSNTYNIPVEYGVSEAEYNEIVASQIITEETSFISIVNWPIESNDYSLGYVILNDDEEYGVVENPKVA